MAVGSISTWNRVLLSRSALGSMTSVLPEKLRFGLLAASNDRATVPSALTRRMLPVPA